MRIGCLQQCILTECADVNAGVREIIILEVWWLIVAGKILIIQCQHIFNFNKIMIIRAYYCNRFGTACLFSDVCITPAVGDLGKYLEKSVHRTLMEQNKLYVQTYRNRSLDAPLFDDDSGAFCMYDVIEVSSSGDIDKIESRIMDEQFVDSLSMEEKKLLKMMRYGFQVS